MATEGNRSQHDFILTRQCVFEDIKLPCKLCVERGTPCDDKVLGPKTEAGKNSKDALRSGQSTLSFPTIPSTLDNQWDVPSSERQLIEFFFKKTASTSIFSLEPSHGMS